MEAGQTHPLLSHLAHATPTSPNAGACGLAVNELFKTAPASNLCSIGSASTVTGSGPWNWTCAGICSGSTASCSAKLDYSWREVSPN